MKFLSYVLFLALVLPLVIEASLLKVAPTNTQMVAVLDPNDTTTRPCNNTETQPTADGSNLLRRGTPFLGLGLQTDIKVIKDPEETETPAQTEITE
mmetsp:Transcript_1119/g.1185  ORF Transcript_1119/g.1185 Transcript_1119/m.1185 type:complete len:96 (+) Transcript_1119:29-316(+)